MTKHWLHPPRSGTFSAAPFPWLPLLRPRWNQAPQPHGFLDGAGLRWLSSDHGASPFLMRSLEIATLQWHTNSQVKGSAGQLKTPGIPLVCLLECMAVIRISVSPCVRTVSWGQTSAGVAARPSPGQSECLLSLGPGRNARGIGSLLSLQGRPSIAIEIL